MKTETLKITVNKATDKRTYYMTKEGRFVRVSKEVYDFNRIRANRIDCIHSASNSTHRFSFCCVYF